jgi:hypothetical protein
MQGSSSAPSARRYLFQQLSTCIEQKMVCNVLIHAIERQVETVENMEGKVQEQVKNGLCRRCNRKLKDPVSVERGFGEICYHKYMAGLKIGKGLFEVKKNVIKQETTQTSGKAKADS